MSQIAENICSIDFCLLIVSIVSVYIGTIAVIIFSYQKKGVVALGLVYVAFPKI